MITQSRSLTTQPLNKLPSELIITRLECIDFGNWFELFLLPNSRNLKNFPKAMISKLRKLNQSTMFTGCWKSWIDGPEAYRNFSGSGECVDLGNAFPKLLRIVFSCHTYLENQAA